MSPGRTVLCALLGALCVAAAGCSGQQPWEVLALDAQGWLLSVAATGAAVVAVGGTPHQGAAPGQGVVTVLPLQGSGPALRLPSPYPGMLWWVHPLADQVAWLCGENGAIIRYDATGGQPMLQRIPTDTSATLYGVWAFADDDVWAVGGADGQAGVVLHGGTAGLASVAGVPRTGTLYKLFAPDRQHLFIVGAAGTALRRAGDAWVLDQTGVPATDSLVAAWGSSAQEVYAVGGSAQGRLLRFGGSAWSGAALGLLRPLTGVYEAPDGSLLVSGQGAELAERAPGAAAALVEARLPAAMAIYDLHGVAGLGMDRFAAGGNLGQEGLSPPRGALLHRGPTAYASPAD